MLAAALLSVIDVPLNQLTVKVRQTGRNSSIVLSVAVQFECRDGRRCGDAFAEKICFRNVGCDVRPCP